MFICSVRASTLRFVGVICLVLALFVGGVIYTRVDAVPVSTVRYTKIKSDKDRLEFLSQLGWQTTGEVLETEEFVIPKTFDRVMLGYNEIQKSQGLDLSRYENKKVTRYTYEVTNYEGYEGKVYANLILFRDRVIAGDICSADPMGFVQGLERTP